MRLSLSLLVVLGWGIAAGAQVAAPEFTVHRMAEQRQDSLRMIDVSVRLTGVVEIKADEAIIDNAHPDEIRLQGNVVARRLGVKP